MKITKLGIDLDNTLINYVYAVETYARENNIEAIDTLAGLRSLLRENNDLEWQRAQAWLYTAGLKFAIPADGWSNFLLESERFNLDIYLVSHKTKYTPKGVGKINIRECAMNWLLEVLKVKEIPQIKGVYFEPSRKRKIARIKTLRLDYFVDDLPEVLSDVRFPIGVKKILYGSESNNNSIKSIESFNSLLKVVFND